MEPPDASPLDTPRRSRTGRLIKRKTFGDNFEDNYPSAKVCYAHLGPSSFTRSTQAYSLIDIVRSNQKLKLSNGEDDEYEDDLPNFPEREGEAELEEDSDPVNDDFTSAEQEIPPAEPAEQKAKRRLSFSSSRTVRKMSSPTAYAIPAEDPPVEEHYAIPTMPASPWTVCIKTEAEVTSSFNM